MVNRTSRFWDVFIHSSHQLDDLVFTDVVVTALNSRQSGTSNDWNIVAREVVRGQKLADFHFHQLEKLFIVYLVNLVHEHDQRRNTNLTRKQNVLTGLRHRAVCCVHNQNRAIHLSSAGDHVLHIVGVTGAVHVCVVAILGLVLDVRGVDGDAAGFFFRSVVDVLVGLLLSAGQFSQHHRDRSRKRRLPVVNVTNGADVYVRLGTIKLFLTHLRLTP